VIGNLIKRAFAGDRAGSSAVARHPRAIGAADQLADRGHQTNHPQTSTADLTLPTEQPTSAAIARTDFPVEGHPE
jgi:hypothetical protein